MDDNETLMKAFIDESREHLATIEADLLTIEESGSDLNTDLLNKVFRAAHSIKGGSGFLGLEKVKQLAHKAETVLDMLRSRKVTPNAEITNVLLAAFDKLNEMIKRTETSEHVDIANLLASLTDLANSYLPAGEATKRAGSKKGNPSSTTPAPSAAPAPSPASSAAPKPAASAQSARERARKIGRYIYSVDLDLIADVEKKDQTLPAFFDSLKGAVEVLDCEIDAVGIGDLDGPIGEKFPVRLEIATVLEPDMIGAVFENLSPEQIHLTFDPLAPKETPEKNPPDSPSMEPAQAPTTTPASVPMPVEAGPRESGAVPPRGAGESPASIRSEETLRVDVGLLDTLMNLAGELVLSRNQVRATVAQGNPTLLASADQRINQVTSELQDVIMQTRLQPLGNVFAKFPRVVRDLSRSLGKEIQLDIQGKDVALDKTLIEGLSDPLTHMVRNAVDHGIETVAERIAAGKKPVGTVRIEARHEAGQVLVEIADDGKGIDPLRIADAAVRKGLISTEKLLGMSVQDKQALIFLPGLSTAKQVSDVSGRGVGMDVVKTNLDRLGGRVEILSEMGQGSTFRIRLPLTLAIIPTLIISLDDERFAIPQTNIEELIRLRSEEIKSRIEIVGDREVLLLRDRILPLARLSDIVGAMRTYVDPRNDRREIDRRSNIADRRSPRHPLEEAGVTGAPNPVASVSDYYRRIGDRRNASSSSLEIAVIVTGTMAYGLVVGSFHETEEVVVKPLGRRLKQLREYSGATILGDGTVALILDVSGLAAKAGLTSVSGSDRAAKLAAETEAQRLQDVHSLLVFHNGADEPCALPLDLVQRIERIRPDQVERIGNHRSMQYGGRALPLVTLSDVASVSSIDDAKDLVVLVASANGHDVGLLGAMPVDVLETQAVIDQSTHRQKGVSGSIILHDQTTLVADLYELVDAAYPDWGAARGEARAAAASEGGATILLAEDSDFFRAQVKKYLEEDGFKVLAAPDGEEAWELLLKHHSQVRVVVTDIEMPRLTGLGLAARIRGDARTEKLPIIAVTSLAAEEDVARGKDAGITEYQAKLDRDQLLVSVHNYAGRKGNIHAA